MNPAVGIIRRVFPSFSNPSAPHRSSQSQHNIQLGSSLRRSQSFCGGSDQELHRLRETVFKLNMEVAACRGAKQRLEATVSHYENMENYYLTQLEVRKARADCLEAQLALVLEEFPSHRPLKLPEKQDTCQGCEQSEKIITKLAHELNLKNKLLIRLDETYKEVVDKVAACLRQYKSRAAEKQERQERQDPTPRVSNFIEDDDKQNQVFDKVTAETQTLNTNASAVLEPLTLQHLNQPQKTFKKSKVILKRVMPQRSADKSDHSHALRCIQTDR